MSFQNIGLDGDHGCGFVASEFTKGAVAMPTRFGSVPWRYRPNPTELNQNVPNWSTPLAVLARFCTAWVGCVVLVHRTMPVLCMLGMCDYIFNDYHDMLSIVTIAITVRHYCN